MQISMAMPTFSVFDPKYPVWLNLIRKLKIVSLAEIYSTGTKSNIQKLMVMFTTFVCDRKYFSENLIQIIKIVSLSWN